MNSFSSSYLSSLINRVMIRRVFDCHHQVSAVRSYASGIAPTNLYSTIKPLGNPNQSFVPKLDGWLESGNRISARDLHGIIRDLRKRGRFNQALQVAEWMSGNGIFKSVPSALAVQLDLIGQVHGVAAAENYFGGLSEENKTEKTYGALLNCYVREHLTEKSLSHLQKMKDLGFASGALCYNDLMSLYMSTSQYEKVPDVLAEMKENGVLPDNVSYMICINSYGARSNLDGMEQLLENMESQPNFNVEWKTYSCVANIYIKAGIADKGVAALKKLEEKLGGKREGEGYNHLISLYSSLGKIEVMRLLKLQKSASKRLTNKDYISLLGSLVKLGEFGEAEALLKEWEESGNIYDSHVLDVLLSGYCHKGLVEKAAGIIEEMVKKGKTPSPNSYGIVVAGYADKADMGKAVEFMKRASFDLPGNEGWKPSPKVVKKILNWFGDEGDVEGVEAFVGLLSAVNGMNREMYHALIKAYIKRKRGVDEILNRMKADKIDVNGETMKILRLRQEVEGLTA